MSKLAEIQERLELLNNQAQQIRKKADDEQRDLSVEEANELDAILASFDKLSADAARLNRLEEQTQAMLAGTGRRTEPDATFATVDTGDGPQNTRQIAATNGRNRGVEVGELSAVPISRTHALGNWNFRGMGDFALSVRRHACGQGTDPRLEISQRLAAASTYGNEAVGSDGGFAVPPDFRTAIMVKVMGEDSLLARCDQIPVAGNSFTCPKDETTPWQTSGGILAYWDGEAAAATQSKPTLESTTVKLNKLRALVPVTEELLDDAPALDAYLRVKAPQKIAFKVNLAILQGSGVGMPLGIINSGCLVTVSKEAGQQADTIVGNNVTKMYSRMPSANKANAVWLINPDINSELMKLSIPGTDNTGNAVTGWGALLYQPPGGLSAAPYGTLLGKPVIETQACETLGDVSDILFCDLSAYMALIKSGTNPKVDVSMHLWFDQDLVAYKFVLRMGGAPWWSAAMSARDGSATYSPFIALEAR